MADAVQVGVPPRTRRHLAVERLDARERDPRVRDPKRQRHDPGAAPQVEDPARRTIATRDGEVREQDRVDR